MNTTARILTASAGTGKTFRLSLEYVRLALEIGRHTGWADPAECAAILVVTFTRKATAEIRQGILAHLSTLVAGGEKGAQLERTLRAIGTPALTQRDRDWLLAVHRGLLRSSQNFRVSTIDGFVGSLFAELIAPWYGLLDWTLETQTPEEVYRDTLRVILGAPAARKRFGRVFERYVRHGRSLDSYIALVQAIVQQRWLLRLMRPPSAISLPAGESRHLGAYRDKFVGLLRTLSDAGKKPLGAISNARNATAQAMRELVQTHIIGTDGFDALAAALSDDFLRTHRIKLEKVVLNSSIEYVVGSGFYTDKVFASMLTSAVAAVADEQPLLLEVADVVLDAYDSVRLGSGRLSHEDVTQYTWEALHLAPHSLAPLFYESITRQTRFLLIDEFQDTSVAQFQIMRPIIDEVVSGRGARDWGGFVIVGDEKQSIYGWRGGESELLTRLPAMYADRVPRLETVPLDANWRSARVVNEFVNLLFGGLSERLRYRGVEWNYQPVKTARTELDGYVEVRFADPRTGGKDGPGAFVRDMVQPAWESGALWGEVAILASRNNELSAISAALNEAGIPHSHNDRRMLLDHPLIKPLKALLLWIERRDVLDLLAFLRSDWVGLDSLAFKELLFALRDRPEDLDLRDANVLARLATTPDLRALGERMAAWCEHTEPALLLDAALHDLGMSAICSREDDLRTVETFLHEARRFERESGAQSIAAFMDWLDEQEAQNALPLPARQDSRGPVLMSIHQSKGLGFDHVLVYESFQHIGARVNDLQAVACKRFDERYESLDEWLLYAGVHESAINRVVKAHLPECKQLTELKTYADTRNLIDKFNAIYVALTRAVHGLYLFNWIPYQAKSWSAYTLQNHGHRVAYPWMWKILNPIEGPCDGQLGVWEPLESVWRCGSPPAAPEVEKSAVTPPDVSSPHIPDWQRLFVATCPSLDAPSTDDALRRMRTSFRRQAPELGELVHDWLAMVSRGEADEMSHADRAVIARWGARFDVAYIGRVCEWLKQKVANSELFAERWTQVLTEHAVFDEAGRLYRIDRILVDETAGEVLVIDFKTGDVGDRWQEARYTQLVKALPWALPQWRVSFRYITFDVNEVAQ
ncbi:MAG: UvrD-helicase domain-containing protein [Candidatus Cloacimonetes bacterium]|nr:UvrD-helicase domain-containing protein [Candidatus Cloacimonadota bacterium]